MKPLLGLLITYLVVNLGVIAASVAIGFLLRWLLPSVDLGTGILIGIVSIGLSIHYFFRLLSFAEFHDFAEEDDDDFVPPVRVFPVGSTRSGRKRKRK